MSVTRFGLMNLVVRIRLGRILPLLGRREDGTAASAATLILQCDLPLGIIISMKQTAEPVLRYRFWTNWSIDKLSSWQVNDGSNLSGLQVVIHPEAEGYDKVRHLAPIIGPH